MNITNFIKFNFENLVKINDDFLNDFIIFLKKKENLLERQPFKWDNENYWLNPSEGPIKNSQYFTVGNSINFKFWTNIDSKIHYVKGIKGNLDCQGSSYMWRCLKVCIENETYPILDAENLLNIDINDMKNIFKTDDDKEIIPHLKERWLNWKDLGKKLIKNYNSQFYNLILKSNNSIENFIKFSKNFRAFDDPLCKMTMVNAILHQGREIVDFEKDIFPGIDYHLMTQILRIGLLKLNKVLRKKIENKKLINEKESLTLRKATLRCFLIIMEKLHISGVVLDNLFFENGKNYCTHKLNCKTDKNSCVFREICKKKINYFMPLENTRYY